MNFLFRHIIFLNFLATLFFAGSTVSFSQLSEPQPKFHNYTVEDGLPASETYFVHQDRKGYIWICTDRGVSRFDGHTFQNFTTADGLTDNVVFKIYEDYKGRIWFVTYNSSLCYFENEKIHSYKYNWKITSIVKNRGTISRKNIYIDKNDNLYLSVSRNGLWIIGKKGNARKVHTGQNFIIKKIGSHFLWIHDELRKLEQESKYKDIDIVYNSKLIKKQKNIQSIRFSAATVGSKEFLLVDNTLYSLNTSKVVREVESAIALYSIHGSAWIGTIKNGVICIQDLSKPYRQMTYLDGLSVSSVLCDRQGGYWFTTLEKGVFYCPSLHIKNYTTQQGLLDDYITSIGGIKDNIYLGFFLGRWQNLKYPDQQNSREITFSAQTTIGASLQKIYISNAFDNYENNGTKLKRIDRGWTSDYFRKDNSIVYGCQSIYQRFDDGRLKVLYDYDKDPNSLREGIFQAVMLDSKNVVWTGSISGLLYVENGRISKAGLNDRRFKVRVSDLLCHPRWKNIVATRGEGIYFFENKKITSQLKIKDGLLSDLINVLYLDQSGGIWAGTNKGLNHIAKDKNGKIHIESFTTLNGLISNEITSLYIYGNHVYVATKAGLAVINTKEYSRNANGKLYLTIFEAGGKKLNPWIHNTLNHNESQIKIGFRNTNYKILDKKQYQYRFSKSSDWVSTSDPEISLFNPLPDDYDLEIRYLNEDGIWSVPVSICKFTIDKAFYNKWYFFFGMLVLIGLLAWRLFRLRIRQLKQRHILNDKILHLEQKALQAQMNPHFIFNALNSIQSYLVYEENDKAEKYLLKFAKLIRQTLNNSREHYITLQSEISTLEKYLDLEQMRFKNKFTYSIQNHLTENDRAMKIPNMLIQPFVENAVIHGFSTIEFGGEIKIRLQSVDGKQILCMVEDNGIGRRKAMEQSTRNHISHGISITEERLRAFESKHGLSLKIETIDIENSDGTKGTLVVINIPIIQVDA